ncbi:MAG: methyltransferase domain-containing protein [Janthinobacterium lividum]
MSRTVAVFHCTSGVTSAWCCAEGIVTTLARMGYRVRDCQNPTLRYTSIEDLKGVDLIILSAVEWYAPAMREAYGDAWSDLVVPKVAWYAESFHRDDRDFDFGACAALADRHYFPAWQDAVEFGGEWLPFGADTEIFFPRETEATIDAGFLGSLYPKRVEYVKRLDAPVVRLNSVSGQNAVESAQMLAAAYCSTKILLNLPSYSRLTVTKVTEAMACGTMVITPMMDHPSAVRNMDQFVDGKHLVYFDPRRPQDIGALIRHYTERPSERQRIAEDGYAEIVRGHSLRLRLQTILDAMLPGHAERPAKISTTEPRVEVPEPVQPHADAALSDADARILYEVCPLCDSGSIQKIVAADCTKHPLWCSSLPKIMRWSKCDDCSHVFTEGYWSPAALEVVFRGTNPGQAVGHDFENQRPVSARMVRSVVRHAPNGGDWLDVGFGNASLVFTADEFGFKAVGVDLRKGNVEALKRCEFEAYCTPVEDLDQPSRYAVVSMADVLEHMPYPRIGLQAAHRLLRPDGVLFLSMPNSDSVVWRALDGERANPYWGELEHYHNFGRVRLQKLLADCGFRPVSYDISERYRACMEVLAVRI